MTTVKSTYEILALKVLNRDIDKTWTDWATEMLRQGYDTENLIILAGESSPYNQFELQRLTNKVLDELDLKYSDKDRALKNYALHLIDEVFQNNLDAYSVLKILKDICIETNYDYFNEFYELFWAKDDLLESEHQFYLENVNRNNIDSVIMDYFKKWTTEYQAEIKTTTA